MLESVALERLGQWFPGEAPFSAKMRPVLAEIDLFVRLRDLFPDMSVDQLFKVRIGMASFVCSRCGRPVDWRIQPDWERLQAARAKYHHLLEEAF